MIHSKSQYTPHYYFNNRPSLSLVGTPTSQWAHQETFPLLRYANDPAFLFSPLSTFSPLHKLKIAFLFSKRLLNDRTHSNHPKRCFYYFISIHIIPYSILYAQTLTCNKTAFSWYGSEKKTTIWSLFFKLLSRSIRLQWLSIAPLAVKP